MKRFIIGFLMGLSLNVMAAGPDYRITDFSDFIREVNILEKSGKFEEAMKLTILIWNQFPEKEFELMKEMIYLNTKLGRYQDNLEIWTAGHEKDYFFLLNNRMERYQPYLENKLFDKLIKKDEALRIAAWKTSKTIYDVILPSGFHPKQAYPLVIILHGGGSNLEKARHRWTVDPVLRSQYIFVFIQSYRHMDFNTFGWRSSDERAHSDIVNCYNEIISEYPVNADKVILCGISAGATMAFDIAFNSILTVSGILAYCPGIPGRLNPEMLEENRPGVFMIGGESDYYLPKQEKLIALFKQHNIKYFYKIVAGMGHEFPENHQEYMREALRFFDNS